MVTNALFAGTAAAAPSTGEPGGRSTDVDLASCRPEADVDSLATWAPTEGAGYEFRYGLARSQSPFAAIACALPVAGSDVSRVRVTGSAVPTMRVQVQFRAPAADRDLRWGSSLRFVDQPTTPGVDRQRFVPLGREATAASLDAADTFLLVIDRRHAKPGAEGVVRVTGIEIGSPPSR